MKLHLKTIARALNVPLVHNSSTKEWDEGYVSIGDGWREQAQASIVHQAGRLRTIVVCYRYSLVRSAGEILHELAHLAVPGSFDEETMLMVWMAEATCRLAYPFSRRCCVEMNTYSYPWRPSNSDRRLNLVQDFAKWTQSAEYKRNYREAIKAGILLPDGSPKMEPVQ